MVIGITWEERGAHSDLWGVLTFAGLTWKSHYWYTETVPPRKLQEKHTHTLSDVTMRQVFIKFCICLFVCLHLCICVSITRPVSDVTLSPNKRVRFLADEISQGLDVVETGCLCTRTFCKICCERASEDIYIFTQHLGYGQPAET